MNSRQCLNWGLASSWRILVGLSMLANFGSSLATACELVGRHGTNIGYRCGAAIVPLGNLSGLEAECCHCPNVLDYLQSEGVAYPCGDRDRPPVEPVPTITEFEPSRMVAPGNSAPVFFDEAPLPSEVVESSQLASVTPKIPPPPICKCPKGYKVRNGLRGQQYCSSEEFLDPIAEPKRVEVLAGDYNKSYYLNAKYLDLRDATDAFSVFQYRNGGYQATSSDPQLKPSILELDLNWWRTRSLNRQMTMKGPNENVWYTKVACLSSPKTLDYLIHLSADNDWIIYVDGEKIANCSEFCHKSGWFTNVRLGVGKHWVEVRYQNRNHGSAGMMYFEIFLNKLRDIEIAQAPSDLRSVFSTADQKSRFWDYQGQVCPDGYAFDACETRKCRKTVNVACRYR